MFAGYFVSLFVSLLISSIITTIVCMAIFGGIGFAIAALKIPDSSNLEITRKAGGEKIDDVIIRYFKFKKKKNRIYVYTKEENK